MLHDLAKGEDNYAAIKRAAEERKGWRYSGMMSELRSLLYSKRLKKLKYRILTTISTVVLRRWSIGAR